jgi:sporulation protein YlmC with PRC-barrel domain
MGTIDTYATDVRERDLNDPVRMTTFPDTPMGNQGPGPRLLTASTLKGDRVINRHDETLGHIEEIMLDMVQGRVAYAVMSSGGFLGLGERLFAIPWSALTLDPDRECFVMDASKDHFDNAPGFDKSHWPSMADRTWHEAVHTHYNARPYWE